MNNNDISRKTRRAACREAGEKWSTEWQMPSSPNPNGNRHQRRWVRSEWRRYLSK